MQEIGKTGGNVLVCPVSLHIALALLYLGAEGKTATDLNAVVGLNKNDVPVGYKALLDHLNKASSALLSKGILLVVIYYTVVLTVS